MRTEMPAVAVCSTCGDLTADFEHFVASPIARRVGVGVCDYFAFNQQCQTIRIAHRRLSIRVLAICKIEEVPTNGVGELRGRFGRNGLSLL
jgi:hypothetical protein